MSIRLLPVACQKKIKSSNDIPTFWKCVEQLLLNSLDAGATCIAVRVNTKEASIVQVIDNGHGVDPEDMLLLGSRYATSKNGQRKDFFGFRGTALASIGHMCGRMTIETRSNKGDTYTKSFCDGHLEKAVRSKEGRKCMGTTVTVEDLFRQLPVRKKAIDPDLTLEWLLDQITVLAIMFHQVSFSVRNESTGEILVKTCATKSLKHTLKKIFSLGYPHKIVEIPFVVEKMGDSVLNPNSTRFGVRGWVGLKPHFNDTIQLICVNRRPVFGSDIHRFVGGIFRKSTICSRKKATEPPKKKAKTGFVGEKDHCCDQKPNFEAEGVKHPVYFLDIRCRQSRVEIVDIGAWTEVHFSDWNGLKIILSNFLESWFKKEGIFVSQVDEEYDLLSSSQCNDDDTLAVGMDASDIRPLARLITENEFGRSINAARLTNCVTSSAVVSNEIKNDAEIAMDNQIENEAPVQENTVKDQWHMKCRNLKVDDINKDKRKKTKLEKAPSDVWLKTYPLFRALNSEKSEIKVTVDQLRGAEIVGQFAESFIALKMRKSRKGKSLEAPVLVLMDQHAADERVRLEQIQAGTEKLILEQKLRVHVSPSEARILEKFGNKLEHFGFNIKMEQLPRDVAVDVYEIPKTLGDGQKSSLAGSKCSSLASAVKNILAEFVQDIKKTEGALSTVPRTLMDIWKMQACRGATMFGESLDVTSMVRIVRELTECQLPFQCAHGRPTVVPIFDMSSM